MKNVFKLIDRGFENAMVFLPGWASDYRIFDPIDIKYNYLHVVDYYPQTIENDLLEEMNGLRLEKISLMGYSLGAFKALDFAYNNPDKITKSYLFALRKKYNIAEINYVKENLLKNKSAYLNGFYKACFANRLNMGWFKKYLMQEYSDNFNLNYLLDTLEYLASCEVTADKLKKLDKVTIFHGAKDAIAPLREINKLCMAADRSLNVFDDAGHAVFLEEDIEYE